LIESARKRWVALPNLHNDADLRHEVASGKRGQSSCRVSTPEPRKMGNCRVAGGSSSRPSARRGKEDRDPSTDPSHPPRL
jgi:hypothetical protein